MMDRKRIIGLLQTLYADGVKRGANFAASSDQRLEVDMNDRLNKLATLIQLESAIPAPSSRSAPIETLMDWPTINEALNSIASQAMLEGILHVQSGCKAPPNNEKIHARLNEALALIHSEIACAQQLENSNANTI